MVAYKLKHRLVSWSSKPQTCNVAAQSLSVVTDSRRAFRAPDGVRRGGVQHLRKHHARADWWGHVGILRYACRSLPSNLNEKKKKSFQCFICQLCSLCLPPQSALTDEMDNFKSKKMFILVSTLMTWAMTRPEDPVSWRETLINLSCKGNAARLIVLSVRRMRLISSSERTISGGDDHIPDSNTTMSWRNLC